VKMGKERRGKHRSTDKEGQQTIAKLENIPGVTAVIIGRSFGGKSIGRRRAVGDFKLQNEVQGGFKGVLQTSKGIQEIIVLVEKEKAETARAIRELFPDS